MAARSRRRRVGEWGEDTPLPSRLECLGERRKLPQRGRVLVHSELERTHVVTTNFVFLTLLFCDTQKCRLHLSVSLQAPSHEPVIGLLEGGYIAYVIPPHLFSRGMHPPRIYAHPSQ